MPRRYILSIDGGGIRGIIPAIALTKLESVTGRPARETFSFVAGTSTGAIIAAALAAGIPASRILDIYLERAREVFPGYRPVNRLRQVFTGSMYSTRKIRDLISSEISAARGWTLNDSPIDILISAKRVPDGKPWYFVRDNPRNSGCTGRLGLVDCVTASAAAPTYFQPWTVDDSKVPARCDRIGTLVDGSLGVAGNPVYQACVEAFHYSEGYAPEDATIVSLGTGRYLADRQPAWILPWLQWVLDELISSPGEQQTELVWRHFPQTAFYRIDTRLEEDIRLDHIQSIDRLQEYGERLAELIDWKAIIAGTDEKFRVGRDQKTFPQYAQPTT
ncbi:MAG TPA: patatin-like phospholipase family protein [Rubrobacteraceae bacterium]|nr:patatin-like phospholipase family protein [Rubrobacteraceae bacterium]